MAKNDTEAASAANVTPMNLTALIPQEAQDLLWQQIPRFDWMAPENKALKARFRALHAWDMQGLINRAACFTSAKIKGLQGDLSDVDFSVRLLAMVKQMLQDEDAAPATRLEQADCATTAMQYQLVLLGYAWTTLSSDNSEAAEQWGTCCFILMEKLLNKQCTYYYELGASEQYCWAKASHLVFLLMVIGKFIPEEERQITSAREYIAVFFDHLAAHVFARALNCFDERKCVIQEDIQLSVRLSHAAMVFLHEDLDPTRSCFIQQREKLEVANIADTMVTRYFPNRDIVTGWQAISNLLLHQQTDKELGALVLPIKDALQGNQQKKAGQRVMPAALLPALISDAFQKNMMGSDVLKRGCDMMFSVSVLLKQPPQHHGLRDGHIKKFAAALRETLSSLPIALPTVQLPQGKSWRDVCLHKPLPMLSPSFSLSAALAKGELDKVKDAFTRLAPEDALFAFEMIYPRGEASQMATYLMLKLCCGFLALPAVQAMAVYTSEDKLAFMLMLDDLFHTLTKISGVPTLIASGKLDRVQQINMTPLMNMHQNMVMLWDKYAVTQLKSAFDAVSSDETIPSAAKKQWEALRRQAHGRMLTAFSQRCYFAFRLVSDHVVKQTAVSFAIVALSLLDRSLVVCAKKQAWLSNALHQLFQCQQSSAGIDVLAGAAFDDAGALKSPYLLETKGDGLYAGLKQFSVTFKLDKAAKEKTSATREKLSPILTLIHQLYDAEEGALFPADQITALFLKSMDLFGSLSPSGHLEDHAQREAVYSIRNALNTDTISTLAKAREYFEKNTQNVDALLALLLLLCWEEPFKTQRINNNEDFVRLYFDVLAACEPLDDSLQPAIDEARAVVNNTRFIGMGIPSRPYTGSFMNSAYAKHLLNVLSAPNPEQTNELIQLMFAGGEKTAERMRPLLERVKAIKEPSTHERSLEYLGCAHVLSQRGAHPEKPLLFYRLQFVLLMAALNRVSGNENTPMANRQFVCQVLAAILRLMQTVQDYHKEKGEITQVKALAFAKAHITMKMVALFPEKASGTDDWLKAQLRLSLTDLMQALGEYITSCSLDMHFLKEDSDQQTYLSKALALLNEQLFSPDIMPGDCINDPKLGWEWFNFASSMFVPTDLLKHMNVCATTLFDDVRIWENPANQAIVDAEMAAARQQQAEELLAIANGPQDNVLPMDIDSVPGLDWSLDENNEWRNVQNLHLKSARELRGLSETFDLPPLSTLTSKEKLASAKKRIALVKQTLVDGNPAPNTFEAVRQYQALLLGQVRLILGEMTSTDTQTLGQCYGLFERVLQELHAHYELAGQQDAARWTIAAQGLFSLDSAAASHQTQATHPLARVCKSMMSNLLADIDAQRLKETAVRMSLAENTSQLLAFCLHVILVLQTTPTHWVEGLFIDGQVISEETFKQKIRGIFPEKELTDECLNLIYASMLKYKFSARVTQNVASLERPFNRRDTLVRIFKEGLSKKDEGTKAALYACFRDFNVQGLCVIALGQFHGWIVTQLNAKVSEEMPVLAVPTWPDGFVPWSDVSRRFETSSNKPSRLLVDALAHGNSAALMALIKKTKRDGILPAMLPSLHLDETRQASWHRVWYSLLALPVLSLSASDSFSVSEHLALTLHVDELLHQLIISSGVLESASMTAEIGKVDIWFMVQAWVLLRMDAYQKQHQEGEVLLETIHARIARWYQSSARMFYLLQIGKKVPQQRRYGNLIKNALACLSLLKNDVDLLLHKTQPELLFNQICLLLKLDKSAVPELKEAVAAYLDRMAGESSDSLQAEYDAQQVAQNPIGLVKEVFSSVIDKGTVDLRASSAAAVVGKILAAMKKHFVERNIAAFVSTVIPFCEELYGPLPTSIHLADYMHATDIVEVAQTRALRQLKTLPGAQQYFIKHLHERGHLLALAKQLKTQCFMALEGEDKKSWFSLYQRVLHQTKRVCPDDRALLAAIDHELQITRSDTMGNMLGSVGNEAVPYEGDFLASALATSLREGLPAMDNDMHTAWPSVALLATDDVDKWLGVLKKLNRNVKNGNYGTANTYLALANHVAAQTVGATWAAAKPQLQLILIANAACAEGVSQHEKQQAILLGLDTCQHFDDATVAKYAKAYLSLQLLQALEIEQVQQLPWLQDQARLALQDVIAATEMPDLSVCTDAAALFQAAAGAVSTAQSCDAESVSPMLEVARVWGDVTALKQAVRSLIGSLKQMLDAIKASQEAAASETDSPAEDATTSASSCGSPVSPGSPCDTETDIDTDQETHEILQEMEAEWRVMYLHAVRRRIREVKAVRIGKMTESQRTTFFYRENDDRQACQDEAWNNKYLELQKNMLSRKK